jgi:GNAT superfamily N-acetyltransferase
MEDDDIFDPKGLGAALAERLASETSLVPLTREPQDVSEFARWDLASWVAIRCGTSLEPTELEDPVVRQHWLERAIEHGEAEYLPRPFLLSRHPFWVVHEGQKIGTVGFRNLHGHQWPSIEVSSMFVHPRFRRKGWATRMLGTMRDVAFEMGFQRVQLGAQWGNTGALRFYLEQGMWVQSWKNYLKLFFAKDQPSWHVDVQGETATFKLDTRTIGVAENRGPLLSWKLGDEVNRNLQWDLEATAALQLALMGWPLIRSQKRWKRQVNQGFSDCGDFEGLAHRIRDFDRYSRENGWVVGPANPSFATLPTIATVSQEPDRFQVTLSDGRELPVPFEALYVMPTEQDPIEQMIVTEDELVCRLRSGEDLRESVDHILCLNQSAEHLEKTIQHYRQMRQARLEAEQRRKK